MTATLTAPEVHGREATIQHLPAELLQLASRLRQISQEGATGGTFVQREERVLTVLIQIYQWTLGESLRGHPLAYTGIRIRELNPGVELRLPNLRTMPFAEVRLEAILVRKRNSHRRRRRFCASGKRWKSIAHVPGGPIFLKHAVVG